MTKVRIRFVAVLLGVLGCLAAGAGQSLAVPAVAPDAVPVASPAAEDGCGTLTATVTHDPITDRYRTAGGVRNSCPGWDRLCVTLYADASPVSVSCTPLSTGDTTTRTGGGTCAGATYRLVTRAYDDGVVQREQASPRVTC